MSAGDFNGEAERRRLWKLAGMGLEFAGAAIGLGALGWWIDGKLGSEPWGMLIGGCLGVTGGMYLLIKEALQAQKESIRRIERKRAGKEPTQNETDRK